MLTVVHLLRMPQRQSLGQPGCEECLHMISSISLVRSAQFTISKEPSRSPRLAHGYFKRTVSVGMGTVEAVHREYLMGCALMCRGTLQGHWVDLHAAFSRCHALLCRQSPGDQVCRLGKATAESECTSP